MRIFEALRRRFAPFSLLYDLRWMHPGAAGGIEQATRELICAIAARDHSNRYALLAPRAALADWRFPAGFAPRLHYSDAGETGPRDIHAESFDLVHSTSGFIHPDLQHRRCVLTMNDLQHVHHPEFFDPADWRDRESLYRDSAARASHVICISEFTRQDMHRSYGIPLEKMTTVWIIPGESVRAPIPVEESRRTVEQMGVSGPFLFYPGHDWPHKNHARLVEAFARAASDLPPALRLVFTGRPFASGHPAAVRIRELGLEDRVIHLGYRPAPQVRALLHQCHALVFPSLFEGFGIPVADAIIAGRPVACSNATSLPEIAGDAAIFFDPLDVEAMAKALRDVALGREVRERLMEAASRRRGAFSAADSARKTLEVYRSAAQARA